MLSLMIESLFLIAQSFFKSFVTVLFIITALSICGLFATLLFLLLRKGESTVIRSPGGSKFILKEDGTVTSASPSTASTSKKSTSSLNHQRRNRAPSSSTTSDGSATATTIKDSGECQWLNFIVKRAMAHFIFKHTALIKQQLLSQLNKELHLPDVVGDIDIIDLNFGSNTPSFYSIRASEDVNGGGGMLVDIDLEFEDPDMKVHLGTDVYINFPVKKFASLPVQFVLQDIYFHAKIRIFISEDFSEVRVSLLEEPDFDMVFSNEIGSRRKIKNLPWITDLINRAIYQAVSKFFLAPKFLSFKLPPIVLFSEKRDDQIQVVTKPDVVSQMNANTAAILLKNKRRRNAAKDRIADAYESNESSSSSDDGEDGGEYDDNNDEYAGNLAGGAVGENLDGAWNDYGGSSDDDGDNHNLSDTTADELDREQIQRLARQLRQRKLVAAAKRRADLDEEFLDFLQSKEASDFQAKRQKKYK